MPNDSFCVICPYYQKTLGLEVFCESRNCADLDRPPAAVTVKQRFANREELNRVMRRYCTTTDYDRCEIAWLNNAEYGIKK